MLTRRLTLYGLLSAGLGGCDKLPASGPTLLAVDPRDRTDAQGYEVIDLDAEVAALLERHSGPSLVGSFGDSPAAAPTQQLGVGDTVQVTVFEAGPGGLFTPATEGPFVTGGRQTLIPPQTIDRDGKISVPYAGNIQAAGRAPKQVAESIRVAFGRRALEPQVIVALVNNAATTASVLGEVTTGGKVNLGIRGERVLDVIAAAGGVKAPEHETFIRLIRGEHSSTVSLRTIIKRPSENIYVQPQDTILVIRERSTFTALGAVGRQGTQTIPVSDYYLSEALGAVGGLLDDKADRAGVFLFRFERASMIRALDKIGKVRVNKSPLDNMLYPIVYRVRLSQAASMFALSRVRVLHRDIVYVATARSVEMDKFLSLVTKVYGAVRGPITLTAQ